jgi:hypothetical protein
MADIYRNVPLASTLRLIRRIDRKAATMAELTDELDVSAATVKRTIRAARELLGVCIEWDGAPGVAGGKYVIRNWGALDRGRLRRLSP